MSYAPVNGTGAVCPECGVPWPSSVAQVVHSSDPERRLDTLLRMTRELLDTDVAVLTEIRDGCETALMVSGEWPGVSLQGASMPVEESFCQRMLEARIGNVISDARADERVADLAMARELGIGAWMGVPIRLSDAELYILCCLASEARPSLGQREIKLLSGLAESVRVELQARSSSATGRSAAVAAPRQAAGVGDGHRADFVL